MIKFEDYKQYLSPVFYKQTNLVAKSASGCYLTDVNGDRYLDFVQGIAVNALGHNYPTVVKAIQEQAGNLVNASFNLVNYPAHRQRRQHCTTHPAAPFSDPARPR